MISCASNGNIVSVGGEKDNWHLLVNDEVYPIQGVGVGRAFSRDGKIDFLALAKEAGANTVRTWGVDQGDQQYFDLAHKHGLKVNAGIWLNPVADDKKVSYLDEDYKRKVRQETLNYVNKFKDHPAILLWNLGNETIYWTESEAERRAFSEFLELLIQDVKRIDPNHPVVYASAYTEAVDYIREYVPSLDIFGTNAYGGLELAHQEITETLDIPYLITEYGPPGPWDRPKDRRQKSIELSDESKAYFYKRLHRSIDEFKGSCLGAFAFYIGDTNQVSSTWWNINYLGYRKLPYLAVREMNTGQKYANVPAIRDLKISKTELAPGERFHLKTVTREPLENIRFEYFASTSREDYALEEFPNKEMPLRIEGEGKEVTAFAPREPGIYRIYAVAVDAFDRASTFNKTIHVKNPFEGQEE